MIDTPQIVQTEARLTAVIRLNMPRDQIQEVMGPAMGEVMAAVTAAGLSPAGCFFTHHLKMSPGIFDFEVGVPVTAAIEPVGRVQAGQWPAATMATTAYHGPYEGLGDAWGEFVDWIEAQGHAPAPDLWECYITGPQSSEDPSSWRTEFFRPLVKQD